MVPENLKFKNIIKNIPIDKEAFDREIKNSTLPNRKYVIFFVARSGSSWLTSILSSTNKLGYPEEYMNPEFVPSVAKALNAVEPDNFLQMLSRRKKTQNGVFGIEVRAIDVKLLGEDVFFDFFDETTVFFNLWRENIISQAISLYRAVTTGRFHSVDDGVSNEPVYDDEGIKKWLIHLLNTENDNLTMLYAHGRKFKNLRYEKIIRDRSGIMKIFSDALMEPFETEQFNEPTSNELKKIADLWNKEAEQRFRQENQTYLFDIENLRLIKQHITD